MKGFQPTERYAIWWHRLYREDGDMDEVMRQMMIIIPFGFRDRVEMADKPDLVGWIYRPV